MRNKEKKHLAQILNRISADFASAAQLVFQLAQDAASRQAETSRPSCQTCAKREQCNETCEKVEKQLPGVHAGLSGIESILDPDFAHNLEPKPVEPSITFDIYRMLLPYHHAFTKPQWVAITLTYRDGMSPKEAAKALGISAGAFRKRLRQADEKKKNILAREFEEGG